MKRIAFSIGLLAAGLGLASTALAATPIAPLPRQPGEQAVAPPEEERKQPMTLERGKRRTPSQTPPRVEPPLKGPRGRVEPPPPESKPPAVVKPPRPLRPPREQLTRPKPPRRPTELHPKWPIKRPPRETIVRRRRDRDRVPPVIFLPPLVFPGIVIDDWRRRYERNRLTWSDTDYLYREEGWVEIVLDSNARGRKLWFEVRDGRIRIDWAEVVFENGDTQVVDFSERSIGPGLYVLLDFPDGRRVDHVRMVAEAASRQVQLTLRMEH